MIVITLILLYCAIWFIVGMAQGLKERSQPTIYNHHESDTETEFIDVQKQERMAILDETIIKYNRLLDSLTEQYKNSWNESERSKILSKQIATMERLNRALEKREKLE